MNQEFHLSITSLGSDRYLIRTEDTATGVPVAETQVEWPVEDWLQLAKPTMDDPIAKLLTGKSDVSPSSVALHQLGEKLYDALFQEGAIRESWLRAQGIAQNREEILRFRLGLKESRLQRLPWEVLHHDGHPLTTRSDLTFTRYAANFLVGQTLDIGNLIGLETVLRVLMVIASPKDQDHLKLLREVKQIQALFESAKDATLPIEIHLLEQPDRSTLAQALEQGNYQVLHYAGHSSFGDSGGELSLVNRQTGLTERLSGDDLAGLLVNNHVVLTVFNSCRSGHTAGDDSEMDWRQQNLVQALVNRGVPSVIAMAERIPDEVAIAFTQLLYKNLRKGYPIDLSLSRTRQGLISAFGSDQHYWALPILYLQPDFDGYLTRRDHSADDAFALGSPEVLLPSAVPDSSATLSEPAASTLASSPVSMPSAKDNTPATDVLAQFESSSTDADDEDDKLVMNFVKELSETSSSNADLPLKASEDEVLIEGKDDSPGRNLYEGLPEVPLPAVNGNRVTTLPSDNAESSPSNSNGAAAANGSTPTAVSQSLFPAGQAQSRISSEKPLLVWFALGLIGIVAIIGLGVLALRWTGIPDDASVSSTTSEDSLTPLPELAGTQDAAVLIQQGRGAIEQGRYADAGDDFALALTQELIGNTEPNAATDAIFPLVVDASQPDLQYIHGRIIWQQIAQLGEAEVSVDTVTQRRAYAAQAQAVWENVDDTSIEGRTAQGFANYAIGDWDGAINSLEAAIALYDERRQRQDDPLTFDPADSIVLHAYAGLVMARTQAAEINANVLTEDGDLADASAEEQAILQGETDTELAAAREALTRLQELDQDDRMTPEQLLLINSSPDTWHNWLWTDSLINDWRRIRDRLAGNANE